MLTSLEIQSLFKKYNVSPSKWFGQNFLINLDIISKIVRVEKLKDQNVLEIGPGLGSLTRALLNEGAHVAAYEIDDDMVKVLKGEIQNKNFDLIESDFLKADLSLVLPKTIIVSNIPYYITSDILFKIFKNSQKFSSAILMMQKEVAERLVAKVGKNEYGKLTITAQIFGDIKILFDVSADSFLPAPKVTSSVIHLKFNNNSFVDNIEFIDFIKKCFAFKRKTLFNNLKSHFPKTKILESFQRINVSENARPQNLSKEDFSVLFNILTNG